MRLSRFTITLLIVTSLMIGLPAFCQNTVKVAALCPFSATLNTATANTQLIAAPTAQAGTVYVGGTATAATTGKKIGICTVDILVKQTTTAADFGLVTGTGSACATGITNLTPQWVGTISVIDKFNGKFDSPLMAPASKAVCLKLSNTPTNSQVLVTYGIF